MNTSQMATVKTNYMEEWKLAMIRQTVIYRIKTKGEKLPISVDNTDYEFIQDVLDDMYGKDLLEQSKDRTYWVLTEKAEEVFRNMRELDDHASQFGIFQQVHLERDVEHLLDNNGDVIAGTNDPRFEIIENQTEDQIEEFGTEDLRIPMMMFLNEYATTNDSTIMKINPYLLVFARMLSQGKIADKDIWFNLKLGKFFDEVKEIVDSQYNWRNIEPSSYGLEEVYSEDLDILVSEGDFVKSDQVLFYHEDGSPEYAGCDGKIVKASIDTSEDDQQEYLVYDIQLTPEFHEEECRNMMSKIYTAGMLQLQKENSFDDNDDNEDDENDDQEVIEDITTEITTEEVWGSNSVYVDPYEPYGYYDVYDPLSDALVFSACAGVLLACCW